MPYGSLSWLANGLACRVISSSSGDSTW